MLDEISKKMLKIVYGFGVERKKLLDEKLISPYRSSTGLRAIFSHVPKTSFYRRLKNLERKGYIIIKGKKRLSRNYEIINGEKIVISSRYSRSRELKLTEKGKKTVSSFLANEIPKKIHISTDERVEEIPFVNAVEYLRINFGIEIHAAFFHLLNRIEKEKFPVNLEELGKEMSRKK